MDQTLFPVLYLLCSVLQTSCAESNLAEVSQLPKFPLKCDNKDTNFIQLPEIRVFRACQHVDRVWSQVTFNCDGRPLNGSDDRVEIYRQSSGEDLGVTCSAPYPVTISTNILAKKIRQSYSVSKNASMWTHEVKLFVPSSGYISCSSLTNPEVSTEVKIYIDPRSRDECLHCGTFVPLMNKELIPKGESESGQKQYLAPCRLNSWFVNGSVVQPELYYGNERIESAIWDPVRGFSFTLQHDSEKESLMSGFFGIGTRTVNCKMGNKFMNFSVPRDVAVSIPRVEVHGNHMKIQSDRLYIHEGNTHTYSDFRTLLYFCRWASSCPLKLKLSGNALNSSSENAHLCTSRKQKQDVTDIEYELGTDSLEPELAQGIVKYETKTTLPPSESGNGMKYFTGLDNNVYKVPGEYSNKSVIQLVEFPRLFYKNETANYTFTCRAIDFVIAPRVYLVVGMKNDSTTRVFTSGTTLTDGRLNRISEYNFNLDLDVDMTKIECHGMDPYNKGGQWRSSNSNISVKYTRAPTAERGHGHERCIILGNCTLECPISGEPMPTEFFWATPRGIATRKEKSLKLTNLKESDTGYYSCFAQNAHGNAAYTYKVSVEDPSIGAWTKAAIAMIGSLLALLATVFAWKYHMAKKYLGGYTPGQIEAILKGNREAAKAAPDGEDKAKHKEFAKFISPRLLKIDFGSKLGEGNYGIVYKCIYQDKFSAAKTCKMGLSNDQMYDILMEIKLMDYVGDHDHIIKFHGVDISRLRSGQLFLVMELSENGSLEHYLREKLYFQYSIMVQSKAFGPKMDSLLNELLRFCLHILSAMVYLESRKTIHGDLGTRNVLLFEGNVAKLADFGYSRKTYNRIYQRENLKELRLPHQWASVELLTKGRFSTASDVWAFGVTAWEILTLGQIPFRNASYTPEFVDAIQKGVRLPQPPLASDELYGILMSCWREDPDQRPSFQHLYNQFSRLEKTLNHEDVKAFTAQRITNAFAAAKKPNVPTAPKNLNGSAPQEGMTAYTAQDDLQVVVQTNRNNNAQFVINVCQNGLYPPLSRDEHGPVSTPYIAMDVDDERDQCPLYPRLLPINQ